MKVTKVVWTMVLMGSALCASDDPIARWAKAVGGREKVAAINSIYREATLKYEDSKGTLKVWHTSDGRYRKEEQIASFSTVETFDGSTGLIKQDAEPVRKMNALELRQNLSRRFANSNAMFFAFFPERHKGTIKVDSDGAIVLAPEGGVDWRVMLDPQSGLPKTMMHQEGTQKVVVTFEEFETVSGVTLEKEIRRSAGDGPVAVIRFTKTVINPPIDSNLFTQQQVAQQHDGALE